MLVKVLCRDCRNLEQCDYRFKPKILPTNRLALKLYALSIKHHVMPFSGGLMNQPHKLMSQFEIIGSAIAEQEENERKAREKKQ